MITSTGNPEQMKESEMRKAVTWTAMNGAMLALAVLAVNGYKGAENVVLIGAWAFGLVSLPFLSPAFVRKAWEEKPLARHVPKWISVTWDFAFFGVLAWGGYAATAVLWLVHMVAMECAFTPLKDEAERASL